MALWLQEGTRVRVQKILEGKDGDKFTQAKVSSSRKDQQNGGYKYSDWYMRFVGKAHDFMSQVTVGDVIVLNKAQVTKEKYTDKEGKDAWPKNPQLVVFDCSLYRQGSGAKNTDEVPEQPEDDSIPF